MVINKLGNVKVYILELNRKCEVINREISAIGKKYQKLELSLNYTRLV